VPIGAIPRFTPNKYFRINMATRLNMHHKLLTNLRSIGIRDSSSEKSLSYAAVTLK
jgi:hypothetical protein